MPCTTAACGPIRMVPAPTVALPVLTASITCGSVMPWAAKRGRSTTTL